MITLTRVISAPGSDMFESLFSYALQGICSGQIMRSDVLYYQRPCIDAVKQGTVNSRCRRRIVAQVSVLALPRYIYLMAHIVPF